MYKVKRITNKPLITPESSPDIGANINGPCLVKVPGWIENPLGKYYLYFAHHQGKYIRMAYADELTGPWKIFEGGVLNVEDTPFKHHVASPDVHVDDENKLIHMYYHGCRQRFPLRHGDGQLSCYSVSKDGLSFDSAPDSSGPAYLRVFKYGDYFYGFCGGGKRKLWRSKTLTDPFEEGNMLNVEGEMFSSPAENNGSWDKLDYRFRHVAVDVVGDTAYIFACCVGDTPERIKLTTVDLTRPWTEWKGTPFVDILKPELDWEGVNEKLTKSQNGAIHEPVHEIRDPDIYREDGRTYMTYSIAGERGIGIVELVEE